MKNSVHATYKLSVEIDPTSWAHREGIEAGHHEILDEMQIDLDEQLQNHLRGFFHDLDGYSRITRVSIDINKH